jgi:hypothetical protein
MEDDEEEEEEEEEEMGSDEEDVSNASFIPFCMVTSRRVFVSIVHFHSSGCLFDA